MSKFIRTDNQSKFIKEAQWFKYLGNIVKKFPGIARFFVPGAKESEGLVRQLATEAVPVGEKYLAEAVTPNLKNYLQKLYSIGKAVDPQIPAAEVKLKTLESDYNIIKNKIENRQWKTPEEYNDLKLKADNLVNNLIPQQEEYIKNLSTARARMGNTGIQALQQAEQMTQKKGLLSNIVNKMRGQEQNAFTVMLKDTIPQNIAVNISNGRTSSLTWEQLMTIDPQNVHVINGAAIEKHFTDIADKMVNAFGKKQVFTAIRSLGAGWVAYEVPWKDVYNTGKDVYNTIKNIIHPKIIKQMKDTGQDPNKPVPGVGGEDTSTTTTPSTPEYTPSTPEYTTTSPTLSIDSYQYNQGVTPTEVPNYNVPEQPSPVSYENYGISEQPYNANNMSEQNYPYTYAADYYQYPISMQTYANNKGNKMVIAQTDNISIDKSTIDQSMKLLISKVDLPSLDQVFANLDSFTQKQDIGGFKSYLAYLQRLTDKFNEEQNQIFARVTNNA